MSDEDRDIDIETDDDDDNLSSGSKTDLQFASQAERRAHHNALERKRRDHIKDSFSSLRDCVPSLSGDKVSASRAQILKKAAEYMEYMRQKNAAHQRDIEDLKKQNGLLDAQLNYLEKLKYAGSFAAMTPPSENLDNSADLSDSDSDEENRESHFSQKKMKTI